MLCRGEKRAGKKIPAWAADSSGLYAPGMDPLRERIVGHQDEKRSRRVEPDSGQTPEPAPAIAQGGRSSPPGRRLTAPPTVDDLLREAVSELRGRPIWRRLA